MYEPQGDQMQRIHLLPGSQAGAGTPGSGAGKIASAPRIPAGKAGMGGMSAKPRGYTCYLCGQQYGSNSLKIHIPQCQVCWHAAQADRHPSPVCMLSFKMGLNVCLSTEAAQHGILDLDLVIQVWTCIWHSCRYHFQEAGTSETALRGHLVCNLLQHHDPSG